jgi:pilus assembly protein CpaB
MARISTAAASRVNRRLLFLALILGVISAALVYVAVSRSGDGGSVTDAGVPVVVAKEAIPAGQLITADMLEIRQVPDTALGFQALQSTDLAIGRVTRFPIVANEQVLLSKFVGDSVAGDGGLSGIVESGMRAMAIGTQQVVGAGGLVLPGDHVDILWVPVEVLEDTFEGAMLLAENVEVLAVEQILEELVPAAQSEEGTPGSAADERVRSSDVQPEPAANTVTLLLTTEQARHIFCAELSGSLRLTVRTFGDATPTGIPPATCVLLAVEE